jgi:hypothetical protein
VQFTRFEYHIPIMSPKPSIDYSAPHIGPKHIRARGRKLGCDTNGVRSVLYWPDTFHQLRTLTIPHGKRDNVSTFRLADGYDMFQPFCTEVGESMGSDDEPLVLPSGIVFDETDDFDDGEYSDQPSTDQLSPDADLRGRIIGPSTGNPSTRIQTRRK